MRLPFLLRSTHRKIFSHHIAGWTSACSTISRVLVEQTRQARAAQKGLLRLQRRHKRLLERLDRLGIRIEPNTGLLVLPPRFAKAMEEQVGSVETTP